MPGILKRATAKPWMCASAGEDNEDFRWRATPSRMGDGEFVPTGPTASVVIQREPECKHPTGPAEIDAAALLSASDLTRRKTKRTARRRA